MKLYQDRGKPQHGPLTNLGDPRRVAIRRRMVQVLVDAYRADYDRWYVLAHSLGTGCRRERPDGDGACAAELSEPGNMGLAEKREGSRPRAADGQPHSQYEGHAPGAASLIADDDEVLHRDVLFAKLRGLATYGSPLDKFAFLWCQIVNINNDTAPWQPGNGKRTFPFEWVNVFEHSDPVCRELECVPRRQHPTDVAGAEEFRRTNPLGCC